MNANRIVRAALTCLLSAAIASLSACDEWYQGSPEDRRLATEAFARATLEATMKTQEALAPAATPTPTLPPSPSPAATSILFPKTISECIAGAVINDPVGDVQDPNIDITRVETKLEGEILVIQIFLQAVKIEFAPSDIYEWRVYVDTDANPDTGYANSTGSIKGAETFAWLMYYPEITKQASLTYWVKQHAGGSIFNSVVDTDTPPDYTYKVDQEQKLVEMRFKLQQFAEQFKIMGFAANTTNETDTFCIFENQ